ncbi:UDP-glycosyltransferase UGT5 [Ptiloglossa arizonensis]|uniref:UDP-glycosyltransferase UGT5 n=1 Tax=Ptiloglossa arizonensis TaxID=3350558 RepID=UPI003F9FDDCF
MPVSRTGWIVLGVLALLALCSAASNEPRQKLKIAAVFGHLGRSHFYVFKPLLLELAKRGHDLTVISHFPRSEKEIAALPLSNYKDISLVDEKFNVYVNVIDLNTIDETSFHATKILEMLNMMASVTCEIGLKNPRLMEFANSGQHFDVVLTESFNTDCFMAVVHKLNAPFIQISTHQLMDWTIERMGISYEASYIPSLFSGLDRPMNFLGRTWNALTIVLTTTVYNTIFHWRDQSIAEKYYGPDIPNLKDVSRNSSLTLLNTHYSLHGAQLFPPTVVETGGMHLPKTKNPLPKDIQRFLDDAHEGVLYFSLGSMVKMSSIPEEKLNAVLNVLGSIPRKVIWKWEADLLPRKLGNVMVKKWLPQYDVLSHPNVKCYFGHGGLLGLTEGVYLGVPMILMPLYGDQLQNSMAAQVRGIAKVVRYPELNEQTLRHAVDEVFNNTSYQENAKRVSLAFRDRPVSPLDTAVWWVEYIARGNALPYLKGVGSKMPWWKRNLLDVGGFIGLVAMIFVYAIWMVADRAYKYYFSKTSGDRKQKSAKKKE